MCLNLDYFKFTLNHNRSPAWRKVSIATFFLETTELAYQDDNNGSQAKGNGYIF